MNKKDLIDKIAEETDLKKNKIEEILDGLLEIILEQVKADDKIKLPNFGLFSSTKSIERNSKKIKLKKF